MALARYLNLHWKMHFPANYCMQNFDFLTLRPNHDGHSGKTKTIEILHEFFMILPWKVNSNPDVYKWVFGIFLFCLDLKLFAKIKKYLVSTHLFFYISITNSISKQNKKIQNTLLQTLLSRKCVQNFSKKY